MAEKQKILASRKAVDAYRTAHTKLYEKGWHRGIPEKHTPLLNIMLGAFNGLGFTTIQEFFDASELLNIQELGFKDRAEFETELAKLNKDAKRYIEVDEGGNQFEVVEDTPEAKTLGEALDGMWR